MSLLFLIFFLILKYKRSLFIYSKYILILFWSFVISLSAIVIKDYRYNPLLVKEFVVFNDILQSKNPPVLRTTPPFPKEDISYFIWTWNILDTYSFGKYIFENNLWEKYILNTTNKYQIWDNLRLVWYIKNVNLFSDKSSLSWFFNWSFDYDKWLIMKGYRGNIYEGNSIIIIQNNKSDSLHSSGQALILRWGQVSTSLRSGRNDSAKVWFISNIKRSLQAQIISTYWESRNAWLIMWMLIWDKSQIPKSDYQKFIDSWLVHLIAVSGWNIIMLTIFLSFVLFFLPFYFRNFIILLSIILYSLVCWMDSSVMRAVLFWWLGMMALFVGREVNFWRSVYIVFVLMLLINPYFILYDLWFLLSFGAIIGIRIFNEKKDIEDKKEIPVAKINNWMIVKKRFLTAFEMTAIKVYNSYIKPSIGANIWILPIIIFFMGKINLVWFITNLFVLPIVPFVMIYGFISIFLYSLLPRSGFIYIQELLIDYIYKISEIGSDYWIYLLVNDYKIKYLILILFIIWLIIYMTKNKIITHDDSNTKRRANIIIKHKAKKSN